MSRAARVARRPVAAPPGLPRTRGWADAGVVLVIAAAWVAVAAAVSRGWPTLHFDTLRDMAYAQNILRGHLWGDPTLAGLPWWYPPGDPLLFAAIARLTGRSMVELYPSSMFWFNGLIPVLLYLLVRQASGRRGLALLALFMVGLGSFWWMTHIAAPMPSVQGLALNLAGLMLWHRAQRGGWPWLVAAGAGIGLSIWHHPLCGMVLTLAIVVHGVVDAVRPAASDASAPTPRLSVLRRAVAACAIGLALAAPLLLHLASLPKHNLAPFEWFGPELHDPRFALHSRAPLMIPLGLVGLVAVWRAWPAARWVVTYFLIGLAGEIAGYLGHDLHWPVPFTIPHEFQWHEQFALGICAAFGAVWLADVLGSRRRDHRAQAVTRGAIVAVVVLATLGPALRDLGAADFELVHLDARWEPSLRSGKWIREHLPEEATIACNPDAGYVVAGLTGRRMVALPAGQMNPAAHAERRYEDLHLMLSTTDPRQFAPVAANYGVTHLMVLPRPDLAAAVRSMYAGWPELEPLDTGDSTVLVYRVRGKGSGR